MSEILNVHRLRIAMAVKGIKTQASLAKRMGVSETTISHWFSGQTQIARESDREKICKAVGQSRDYLFTNGKMEK